MLLVYNSSSRRQLIANVYPSFCKCISSLWRSDSEHLLQFPHRTLRTLNTVSHCPTVLIDLIIISTFVCLISKEMYSRVVNPADLLLRFQVLQAVGLVPAGGEDVKGDLAADRVSIKQAQD